MTEKGGTLLARITQIIDIDNFWAQIGTDKLFAELLQQELSLSDVIDKESTEVEINTLQVSQLVAVDCTENNETWRRGLVSRIDRASRGLDVFFIDYGQTEFVSVDKIYVDIPDWFSTFPSLACKCRLAGIKPIAKTWTTKANRVFESNALEKVFKAILVDYEFHIYSLALYMLEEEIGKSLASVLIDLEVAQADEQNQVPDNYTEALAVTQLCMSREDEEEPLSSQTHNEIERAGNGRHDEISTQLKPDHSNTTFDQHPFDKNTGDKNNGSLSLPQHQLLNNGVDIKEGLKTDGEQGESCDKLGQQCYPLDTKVKHVIVDKGCNNWHEDEVVQMEQKHDVHEAIPEFNLHSLSWTSDLSVHHLNSKKVEKRHKELQEEKTRLLEDMKEQEALVHLVQVPCSSKKEDEKDPQDLTNSSAQRCRTSNSSPRKHISNSNHIRSSSSNTSSPSHNHSQSVSAMKSYPTKKNNGVVKNHRIDEELLSAAALNNAVEDATIQGHRSSEYAENVNKTDNKLEARNGFPESRCSQEEEIGKKEFVKRLNKIFVNYKASRIDEISTQLRNFFCTDLFLYLEEDQLVEVVKTLLTKAVRLYGDIHDVIMEIIEVIQVTPNFAKSIHLAIKKLQEMFIKVTNRGTACHIETSKIIGHIFNLSVGWEDLCSSELVQTCVLKTMEKWLYFNKNGSQFNQIKLEAMYLQCFKALWSLSGSVISNKFPEALSSFQLECRDKILSNRTSRSIKEDALSLYIECLMPSLHLPSSHFSSTSTQTDLTLITDEDELQEHTHTHRATKMTLLSPDAFVAPSVNGGFRSEDAGESMDSLAQERKVFSAFERSSPKIHVRDYTPPPPGTFDSPTTRDNKKSAKEGKNKTEPVFSLSRKDFVVPHLPVNYFSCGTNNEDNVSDLKSLSSWWLKAPSSSYSQSPEDEFLNDEQKHLEKRNLGGKEEKKSNNWMECPGLKPKERNSHNNMTSSCGYQEGNSLADLGKNRGKGKTINTDIINFSSVYHKCQSDSDDSTGNEFQDPPVLQKMIGTDKNIIQSSVLEVDSNHLPIGTKDVGIDETVTNGSFSCEEELAEESSLVGIKNMQDMEKTKASSASKWAPGGQRKCTGCKSVQHTIYQCPLGTKTHFL